MCKEKHFIDNLDKKKSSKKEPVEFYQSHLTDLDIDESKLRLRIITLIEKLVTPLNHK